jgi:hemolysin D
MTRRRLAVASIIHALAAALALDQQRRQGGLLEHTDFHPPAIALLETPASPTVHGFIFTLIALVVAFLIFATLGRLETVAEATGEVVSSGRSKVIQPFEQAVVRVIRVHDGQRVAHGDVLIEFDDSQATSDLANYSLQLRTARWTARRARALAELALHQGIPISDAFERRPDDDAMDYQANRELVSRTITGTRKHLAELNDDIAAKSAELSAAREGAERYAQTLPLLKHRVEQRQSLVADGYQTEFDQSELRQQLIEMEKDYSAQQAKSEEAAWALKGAGEEAQRTTQEFVAQELGQLEDAQKTISEQTRNVSASTLSLERLTVRAPIDGIVQQLAVHTVGGVVTPAEQLMLIAPLGSKDLEISANIQNRDIAFVRVGQRVRIKVETYDFTRYGTIDGRVESVSGDAAKDEKSGLLYPVQISLADPAIRAGNKVLPLRPGMGVTAEVVTGSRTIAEYLMSPLRRTIDESLKER